MIFNKFRFQLPKLRRIDVTEVENMCNDLVSIFSNLTHLGLNQIKDLDADGVSTIVHNNPKPGSSQALMV